MSDYGVAAFIERKQAAVLKAERALSAATDRLATALREYDDEVARHQERGDGFFSSSYLARRREAVLARKFHDAKVSALNTARAEAAAPQVALTSEDAS